MVHDVQYGLCRDDKKCKNEADRKMVKALDSMGACWYHKMRSPLNKNLGLAELVV